ncbi:MAG TPA: electron transfer flavoprotein subunit alpha/FixB family protein [Actinomycetota bacterium]|nr:electron transfer flavoprotein subunit alpha/FixB family protein [Actinomycetota bacterium]
MTRVWIWADVAPDGVAPSAFELATKARAVGGDVGAVALGPGASEAVEALGDHGATLVYTSDDERLVEPTSRVAAHTLAALVAEHAPDVVLFPSSYRGRDVAGRLQGVTGSTLMANAVDLPSADRARAEILGGTTIVEVALEGPRPHLVMMRPRSFEPDAVGGTAEAVAVDVVDPPGGSSEVRVLERTETAASGPSLDGAKVVLAGGRGLGGPDGFRLLEELAAAIGDTAIGASRAAVDAGWVPYAMQIGQTGATVKPEVYLAAGISGALQHAVGMKGSRRIVAITKDPEAPILKLADLGVVGDLFHVLPAVTEEVRRRTGR